MKRFLSTFILGHRDLDIRFPEGLLSLSRPWQVSRLGVAPDRNGNSFADVLARSFNNLVARSVGIISAACISAGGSSTHRSSSDAHRHSASYGCTTVDATAIDTTMVNASPTNSNASSVCEGVS